MIASSLWGYDNTLPYCVRGSIYIIIHGEPLWLMALRTLGFLTSCQMTWGCKILHGNRGAQRLILFYFGAKPPPTTTHHPPPPTTYHHPPGSKVEKNQSLPDRTPISMENFQVTDLLTKGQKPQSRKYLQPQGFSMHYYIYIHPHVYMGGYIYIYIYVVLYIPLSVS